MYAYRDGQLTPLLNLDEDVVADRIGKKHFNPSGIKQTGEALLLISGKQTAWAELDLAGDVLHAQELSGKRHKQIEGIERTRDGRVILGDESGKRSGSGRLGVYAKP